MAQSKKKSKSKSKSKSVFVKTVGSRSEVMHGTALRTSGNLRKRDLRYNKHGRIVSKKRSLRAKREKRLEKAGYFTKKGVFGSERREPKSKKKSKRR